MLPIAKYRPGRVAALLLTAISLAWVGCGPSNPTVTKQPRDSGVGLENIDRYAATFEIEFTPDGGLAGGWTYSLDIVSNGAAGLRRSLSMEGVSTAKDPGDTLLTRVGESQYMTGEGVGDAGCLIFPVSIDLDTSFLMPGDFIALTQLRPGLVPVKDEMVAERAGQLNTFKAGSLGDFTDVSGEIVIASVGNIVLRYEFSGHTVDNRFADGLAGILTWHYAITDTDPAEDVAVPEGCTPEYPVMADATELSRLPGLIKYISPSTPEVVLAFYEQTLTAEGWLVLTLPKSGEGTTVLSYARQGETLNVSVRATLLGTEVQVYTEDKAAQP